MPTRKQKENAIAGKFPPNAKRGRGANRILFMTGALADLIGVPHYDIVKVSELTDEQIDLLYNSLYNKTAGSLRSLEMRIARLEESQKRASIDPFFSVKHGIISALGGLKKLQKSIGAKVRDLGLRGKGVRIHFRLDTFSHRPFNMVEICLNDSGLYDMNFRRETHNRGRDTSYSDKVDNVPEGALAKTFERMTGLKLGRDNFKRAPYTQSDREDTFILAPQTLRKWGSYDPMEKVVSLIEAEARKLKSVKVSPHFEATDNLDEVELKLSFKKDNRDPMRAREEVIRLKDLTESLLDKYFGRGKHYESDSDMFSVTYLIDEG